MLVLQPQAKSQHISHLNLQQFHNGLHFSFYHFDQQILFTCKGLLYQFLILATAMISFTDSITQVISSPQQRNTNGNNSTTNHLPYQNGGIEASNRRPTNQQTSKEQMKKSGYLFEDEVNNGFNFSRQSPDSTGEKEEASQFSMIVQLRNQLSAKDEKIIRLQKKIYSLQSLPKNPQRDLEKGSPGKKSKHMSLTIDEQTRMTKKLKQKIQQHKTLQKENEILQQQKQKLRIKIKSQYQELYESQIHMLKLQNEHNLLEMDLMKTKINDYEKKLNPKEKVPLMKKNQSKTSSTDDYDRRNQDNQKLREQNSKMKQQVQSLRQIRQELDQQLKIIKEERVANQREKVEFYEKIKALQKDVEVQQSRIDINFNSSSLPDNDSILHLTKNSEQRLEEIMKLEENIRNLTDQNERAKKQAEQANRMSKQLKIDHLQSAKKWQSDQRLLQEKLDQKELEAKHFKDTNETLQYKITSLEERLQKGRKENEKVNKALESLTADFTQLRRTKDKLQLQLEKQAKEKTTLTKKVEGLSSDKEKLENERNVLKTSITQLQKDNKTLQEQLNKDKEQADREMKQQKEINAKSQAKMKDLELKVKALEENSKKMQEKILDLGQQKDRISNELQCQQKQRIKLLYFNNLVKQQMVELQNELGIRVFEKAELDTYIFKEAILNIMKLKYFNDSVILSKMESGKTIFLANQLKGFIGGQFRPQLVYRFDVLNTTNFHTYFDKKKNLLAIIQLKNGTVIGGFTESAFDPSIAANYGKGILFSLTDQKVYKMRQESKIPVNNYYDKYYFILGNAEIRLKSQEKKMFSNFGISNSTFDNAGGSKSKFLKVDEKALEMTNSEVQIETYEFYELKLAI